MGFWYALEDCTLSNGCLSFAPGSHKRAPVTTRFVRKPEGGTDMAPNHGPKFPKRIVDELNGQERGCMEGGEKYIPGEVKAGTLVLIHGNIMHKSERNLSQKSRFICELLLILPKHRMLTLSMYIDTFHIIEGKNEYDDRNWLQPPNSGFSKLCG